MKVLGAVLLLTVCFSGAQSRSLRSKRWANQAPLYGQFPGNPMFFADGMGDMVSDWFAMTGQLPSWMYGNNQPSANQWQGQGQTNPLSTQGQGQTNPILTQGQGQMNPTSTQGQGQTNPTSTVGQQNPWQQPFGNQQQMGANPFLQQLVRQSMGLIPGQTISDPRIGGQAVVTAADGRDGTAFGPYGPVTIDGTDVSANGDFPLGMPFGMPGNNMFSPYGRFPRLY